MKVVVKRGRLAFAQIWEPKSFDGRGEPRCSASIILDPKSQKAEVDKIVEAIQAVATEKWGAKGGDVLKGLKAKGDICLHDGATKAEYDGFEGMVYLSAANKARPVVVDRDKTPLTQQDGRPYSGCYCDFSVDIWPQDNNYGKRINAKLLAIRFYEDGPGFSGGTSYSDADFEDDDDAVSAAKSDSFF